MVEVAQVEVAWVVAMVVAMVAEKVAAVSVVEKEEAEKEEE